MSLLQASVYAHFVVVAADTMNDYRDWNTGERVGEGHGSKLLTIAHMPAIVAARGFTSIPSVIAGFAFQVPDFDTLMTHFAEQMMVSVDAVAGSFPHIRACFDAEAELILAGWSNGAGRLRTWHAWKPAGERFTLTEIRGEAWAPLPYADGTTGLHPQSVEDWAALARLQVARIRSESDGVAGGDLTVATLSRDAVKVEVVRDFMSEAAGAPETGEAALAGA